jgi:hypothetical protein
MVQWLQLILSKQKALGSSLGLELASLIEGVVFFFSYFTPVTAQYPKITWSILFVSFQFTIS